MWLIFNIWDESQFFFFFLVLSKYHICTLCNKQMLKTRFLIHMIGYGHHYQCNVLKFLTKYANKNGTKHVQFDKCKQLNKKKNFSICLVLLQSLWGSPIWKVILSSWHVATPSISDSLTLGRQRKWQWWEQSEYLPLCHPKFIFIFIGAEGNSIIAQDTEESKE